MTTVVLSVDDSSRLQPLTDNPSVRVLTDSSSIRLIIRSAPQGSSNKNGTSNPVPQATNNVRKENISRRGRAIPAAPTGVSRRAESLPPGQSTASRIGNSLPPPATNLSNRRNAFPSAQTKASKRGDTFPPATANLQQQSTVSVSRRSESIPPVTMSLSRRDESLPANNAVGRPRKRMFGAISGSPVVAICPSVSQRSPEIAAAAIPSDSPPVFQNDPALPSNSLTDDRQCSSRSTPSVDHGANALALVTAPAAVLLWQNASSAKPKENEATALKKKLMNITSLQFQSGLQRIILSLGQLVSHQYPSLRFLI